ncbi:MAG: HigA family addiction module antitoxin [Alphaproteobacteria bacterium]|jgi:addiction module HigA family antidote
MLITNPPIHPGEILRTEFMEPLNLTAGKLAKAIGVPRTRIERLVQEKTALTTDTAVRLGKYLGTDTDFWMNLRTSYDASVAHQDPDLQRALDGIKPRPMPEHQDEAA